MDSLVNMIGPAVARALAQTKANSECSKSARRTKILRALCHCAFSRLYERHLKLKLLSF